jgi:hypothetical protein
MNINKSSRGFDFFKGFLALILLCLLSAPAIAANFPLEIIQPQPNLDTKNRFYKAYPDLEYNVRLAVIGGEYPFRFALTSGPMGMTIDRRGEIAWVNPVASANPYSVTATVTDAQSITKSVSWTITVTTSGFRFIDAVNGKSVGQGGTGTKNNPWKSMKDMYEGNNKASKSANSYAGEFVYWRAGTYTTDAYKEDGGNGHLRVPFVGNKKPQVWLAYPGEKPIIDLADASLIIYGGGSNTYFDGMEINVNGNSRGMGIAIASLGNNVTFRRNKFYGLTQNQQGGNNSLLFITHNVNGSYWSIQDNEMYDVKAGYALLGYSATNVLVENNIIHHIGGHAISPKTDTRKWFIRSNRMYLNNNNPTSINVQMYPLSGDIEISYNVVESGGGMVRINTTQNPTTLPVYISRNTFMDQVQMNRVTSTNGIFNFSDNVIINEMSYPDKIQRKNIEAPSRLIVTNNLTGSAADNIVDSQGYLTAPFSSHIGYRGHQLGQRPSAPTAFTVTAQ